MALRCILYQSISFVLFHFCLYIELNQSLAYSMVHSHVIRPNENVFAVDLKENVFNILTLTLFE